MIGGHWDSSEDWSVLDNTQLTDTFLLLSKFLWRQGFVRTPESCSDDTPHSECMPTCPEGIIGSFDTLTDDESYDILRRTGALALDPISNLENTMSAAGIGWTMVLKELCHVGSPGEMFTSAAPQDPTFWPLHGNAERLLGALRIYKNRGLINFDETWGYSHFKALPSDTGVVCDWTEATGTLDMPKCTAGTCSGHKEDDLLPFTDLYKEQGDSLLTNADFYTLINPLSDELPYAFDSLFYWEACDEHNLYDEKFGTTKDTETKSLWSRVFQGVWGVM
jgi:hypothetical protein